MLKIKDTCFRLCLGFHAPSFFLDAKIDKKLVQGQPGHSISFESLPIRQHDVCLLDLGFKRLGEESPMPLFDLDFMLHNFFLDLKIDKKLLQGHPKHSGFF